MMVTRTKVITGMLVLSLTLFCCQSGMNEGVTAKTTVVFKHGKIAGDPEPFRRLLDRFEREHPSIRVKDETLPASTDEQHQFYVINLEGKSADIDVLAMDVIWVQEFVRAGWLREVGHLLGDGERNAFFPGPVQAVTYGGKLYAIPWYIDAGILYYRRDLLQQYGRPVPKTWSELVSTARSLMRNVPNLYGYIWQGKQYEGLVCNVLEYFWSNGGDIIRDGQVVINSPENIAALAFMRDLITKEFISPPLVMTAIEEPTRHLFGSGKALFLRNWPYAWNIFQRADSPVRNRVGVAPLPAFPGHDSAATLGGWQLGISRFSRHPEAAEKLVRYLASPAVQKELARTIGYKPSRKSLYEDPDLLREQPFMASLYGIFLTARPRPVTPYYLMITQVLQPEFSAALTRMKTPKESLDAARQQVEHILGTTL